MQQGSDEWREARAGKITASRFGAILTAPKSKAAKESGTLSGTAQTYLYELVAEHFGGHDVSPELRVKATEWGQEYEDEARREYSFHTGYPVLECGFHKHPEHPEVGCSPDGLIALDGNWPRFGLLEIKCKITAQGHAAVLVSGELPKEHLPQVQGALWITGCEWCDFVSYHPRMCEATKLVVVRVERDETYIDELAAAVLRFRDRLRAEIDAICQSRGIPSF